MESSVKNISRPVIDRLPVDVNQLDEFACRQLDKVCLQIFPILSSSSPLQFEKYRRASTSDDKIPVDVPLSQPPDTSEPVPVSKVPRDHDQSVFDATNDGIVLSCLASNLL